MSSQARNISAKKAWAQLSERARLGEKFGFIAYLGLLYKSGQISKAQVVERMNAAGVSKSDLLKFKEQCARQRPALLHPQEEQVAADREQR